MARINIFPGSNANDGTGDDIRSAFISVNANFTELYAASPVSSQVTIAGNKISANASDADLVLEPSGAGAIVFPAITINNNYITGTRSNEDLVISASGTGDVIVSAVRVHGTTISSDDSTKITLAEAVDISWTLSLDTIDTNNIGSNDSTSIHINDSLNVSGTLSANTIDTNTIYSGDSGAIQIDTGLNVSGTLSANTIDTNTISSGDSSQVTINDGLTLSGSFKQAIHTFVATDAITETEPAGRTLLLGEVGGNALVTLTLPDATGSGATYKFIVSVANTSNYVIVCPDANNTIGGIMMFLDEDEGGARAYPTVAASDTITLNGGTTGGLVGDYLELVDIATDKWHVRGCMRVSAGTNTATPFSATV